MKLRSLIFAIIVAAAVTAFTSTPPPSRAAATSVRVALLEYAVAHQSVVRLSDLLPNNSPRALRDEAATIVLGDAPFPGAVRDFPRERIESAIASAPALRGQFEIPAIIHVTRWSRILSSDEVLHATKRALQSSNLPESAALDRAKVEFSSPVLLAAADSAPEATSIDLSAEPSLIRARLWIPSEPRITPFWVEIRLRHDAASLNAAFTPVALNSHTTKIELHSASAPRAAAARANDPALLVHSGKTVNLVLRAPGMTIATNAAAMQSGRQGDEIRVRVLPSGRLFVAKVVAISTVETNF